jgi:L-iditol 2-dehydrogenase
MRACVLRGINDLRVENIKKPTPKAGEVLIEIKAAGICGSDIPRVFTKGTYHFPTVPRHEFAGLIVEAGEGVDSALVGKRAAVFPLLPCMKCESCQVGAYAQCKDYDYFGSRRDGGFAEYLSVPVWNLVFVPDNISYEEAAMCEPSSVAIHALRQQGVDIGDNVAIFGAGPIGIMLGLWAKAWGADKVMLFDIDKEKVAFAKKLGFRFVYDMGGKKPVDYVIGETAGRGADLLVEGAGVSITLETAIKAARTFGRIVCMGNPAGDMVISQKVYSEILRKQISLKGSWNSSYAALDRNEWELSLKAMSTGLISVKPLITHRCSLDEGVKPFLMMRNRNEFFNKVMFTINT